MKKNNIERQYLRLLDEVLKSGVKKSDRTGTGTLSVFGRNLRHDMSEGFPLLTTKKMYWNGIVTELLWFLRGDTNIKYLVDNDCHIWDGDAYKRYEKECIDVKWMEPVQKELNGEIYEMGRKYDKEGFITRIKTDMEFAEKWGDLGPIYGKQWRKWNSLDEGFVNLKEGEEIEVDINHMEISHQIDQIANLILDLKTNPDSRRLMVSAWNVGELDQMVLPPCHYGFQVWTRELTWDETVKWVMTKTNVEWENLYIVEEAAKESTPKRAISLSWNQRSVDMFLGLPFNIASYALLLEIIAKEVNMVPDQLVANLGDCHIYSNHIEQAKEQIRRETRKLPSLLFKDHLNGLDNMIDNLRAVDFVLDQYNPHPAISAKLNN